MSVHCNGFPKSGNHALVKACELLGIPARVNHLEWREREEIPEGTTHRIFIRRDPRNIIVSWLRFHGDVLTPGKFMARFRRFGKHQALVDEMAVFEGWLDAPNVLQIRYEDLTSSDRAMRAIADYLGVPYIGGAFAYLENHTPTWNAEKSDYRQLWCDEVQQMWDEEGGNALLARWGY